MKTPIVDFVKEYVNKNALRLHMPGHKGIDGDFNQPFDLTEIDGADSLFSADGIIKESMQNAGDIFGADTFYSTEGSSLPIRAMLFLIIKYAIEKGEKPLVLAGRNAHKSFVLSAGVLGIDVEWLCGDENYLSCQISPLDLITKLDQMAVKPVAVYLTSPDYLGNTNDIEGISKVLKERDILLIVDNAHGAYLKFLDKPSHPIDLGATMCCDSAHKTLPCLTGGAYLHVNKKAPCFFKQNALMALSVFASTSPSYLVLQSLDSLNAYLFNGYKDKLLSFVKKVDLLKNELALNGYVDISKEKLKITLLTKKYGYTGEEFNKMLQKNNIVCEFYDNDHIVFMLTPELSDADLDRLKCALLSIKKRDEILLLPPLLSLPERKFSIKDGLFAPSEIVPIEKALGRVLSIATVSCPPAVPILVCGEVIDQKAIDCFNYYNIKTVSVVK